jgi:hypothetical protein
MSDQRFFDLAMKAIAQQASEAERAELEALLAREPGLHAEFARLQADTRLVHEVLPLVNATEATAPELPAYARGRLQTKVRQTLGRPELSAPSVKDQERRMMWRWRWLLGLAAAAAAVMLVVLPLLRQAPAPVIQVAMLDTAGASRGSEASDLVLLQQTWKKVRVGAFDSAEKAQTWETNWPADLSRGAVVKILYDRPAGEVRVLGRWNGTSFAKTFVVEQDLSATLKQVNQFIQGQTRR